MKTVLQFEFTVDKTDKTINVKREFAADQLTVWAAWTQPEWLDQWWAPKPYRAETKSMDFRPGGVWLYAMISPENEKHWSRVDYREVEPTRRFSGLDAFCDEDGNVNPVMPGTAWNNVFSTAGEDRTLVDITLQYESLDDLERIIEMGFKEGFTMGLQNLDELLLTHKK